MNPNIATIFHDGSNDDNCERNISDADYPNWHCPAPEWGYPVVIFSMILVSISASFRAGLPSKIAAQWFDPNEYDIANALASSADAFGTMITFLLVPFVAKEPSDLLYLQVYFAIPVFLSFIGSLFIRQEGYKNEVNKQSFKVLVVALIKLFHSYLYLYIKKRLNLIFRTDYTRNYLLLAGFFIYSTAEVIWSPYVLTVKL